VSGDPVQYFFLERYAQAYANEINAFIDSIDSGNRSPKPGGIDGLQAQKLADAATVSWQTGRPLRVD
ncbi:Gfo/Idh/MocA family oxidoreductase, partial [Rhizobium ruizarguesonis]